MLTQKIKELRLTGIGGSDASAIAGHNKYKNAVDVYMQKLGLVEEKDQLENIEDLRRDPRYFGHVLEPVVASLYENFEGKKVEIEPAFLRHPKYTWMVANVDRRIVGENALLECKTAHEYKAKDWGEEYTDHMPDEYLFQCMHYAIVCDVGYVDCAVLIGGNKYQCYRYERDQEAEQMLIDIEHDFWHNNVLKKSPPVINKYEEACKLWKRHQESQKVLPPDLTDHIRSYDFSTKKIKELQEQADFDKAKICEFMQESSILLSPLGSQLATWKTQETERFDTKAFKKAFPDIYKEFINITTSRVFRLKEIKV